MLRSIPAHTPVRFRDSYQPGRTQFRNNEEAFIVPISVGMITGVFLPVSLNGMTGTMLVLETEIMITTSEVIVMKQLVLQGGGTGLITVTGQTIHLSEETIIV